jgi:hypothetical protein
MKIDGSCLCGFIKYEAEVDSNDVSVCHCTDCQTLSGSAFRVGVPIPGVNFKLLSGQPKTYVKTAESGAKRAQVFCPECGSALYSTSVGEGPKIFRLRITGSNQRHAFTPTSQGWFRSAHKWVTELGSIPAAQKQR